MKIVLIVLGIIIVYLSLGYAATAVICAIEEDNSMDDDTMLGAAIFWILVVPLYIVIKLIPWIGRKLAFIPVLIVALIKAKKEGEE